MVRFNKILLTALPRIVLSETGVQLHGSEEI